MQVIRRPQQDLSSARATFNSAALTVGSLYLATHSVTATLIGAAASTLLACWAMQLPCKPTLDDADQLSESRNRGCARS
jgi:hypothetical protein